MLLLLLVFILLLVFARKIQLQVTGNHISEVVTCIALLYWCGNSSATSMLDANVNENRNGCICVSASIEWKYERPVCMNEFWFK